MAIRKMTVIILALLLRINCGDVHATQTSTTARHTDEVELIQKRVTVDWSESSGFPVLPSETDPEIPMIVYITSPLPVMPAAMQELWKQNAAFLEGAQVRYHNENAMIRGVKEISAILEKETDIHGAWEAFQNLRPGAFRADMWRTMMLWAYGGIYIDCDIELKAPISTWIKSSHAKLFLVKDCQNFKGKDGLAWAYWNAMIAAVPRHKVLEHALRTMVHNVQTHYYGKELRGFNPLSITGPREMGATLESYRSYHGSLESVSQDAQLVVEKDENGLDDPKIMVGMQQIAKHRRSQGLAKTYVESSTHYDALYRLHLVYCDEGGIPCTFASQRYLAKEHGRLLRSVLAKEVNTKLPPPPKPQEDAAHKKN